MSYMPPQSEHPSYERLLSPLNLPFEPPFEHPLRLRTHRGESSLGLYEEDEDSPISGGEGLATPNSVAPDNAAHASNAQALYSMECDALDDVFPCHSDEVIAPPPAPVIKDLDSFSQGTGLGSFDFSLTSESGHIDDVDEPRPSLAFSPSHPEQSIDLWRNDVLSCTATTGTGAIADSASKASVDGERRAADDSCNEEPAAKRRRLSEYPFLERLPTAPPQERQIPLPFASIIPVVDALSIRSYGGPDNGRCLSFADIVRPSSAPPVLRQA